MPKKYLAKSKFYFGQKSQVSSCAFHFETQLLSIGFDNGVFGIWELPDFINIHSLSISQKKIDAVAFNSTGEWLAFGCSKLGQMLVWEWQSESYILKQQGHQHEMTCLDYSADSQLIATGGLDGKVKLWNTTSGFCFVTFSEHTAAVTCLKFAAKKQIVISASLDGTVRAFDLIRYRNFKTFTSPTQSQFSCVTVDYSCEVICAGSQDLFEIYLWSLQTGQLIDIVSGHTGPISSVSFSPLTGQLASSSWDKSVRVWDVYSRDVSSESLEHSSEVLAMTYSPDGKSIAATTLNGTISVWSVESGKLVSEIHGSRDIATGRRKTDLITVGKNDSGKHFTSIAYTSDGTSLIAGGNSKFVCIYNVSSKMLLRRFAITSNQSLDGMNQFLNSKNMTEAGPKDLIDIDAENEDLQDRIDFSLPGVIRGDDAARKTDLQPRTSCVKFAGTGQSWSCSTPEGLMVYRLDNQITFDPFDLELDITPDSINNAMAQSQSLKALIMSFRLGDCHITRKVYVSVPLQDISHVVRGCSVYISRLIKHICEAFEEGFIGFNLKWMHEIMRHHARHIRDRHLEFQPLLLALQKAIKYIYTDISNMYDIW